MVNSKQQLIVLGAGGFAREAKELIDSTDGFHIACFVEGLEQRLAGGCIDGVPVVWIGDIATLDKTYKVLSCISSPKRRELVERVAGYGFEFTSVVAPSAEISSSANIGKGCLISRGVILAAAVRVSDQVFINRAALIGHDATVECYATISQGAILGGGVAIGAGAFVGMGATVLENLAVGRGAIVGAGAVVTKDVPDNVQVFGVPARITKAGPFW